MKNWLIRSAWMLLMFSCAFWWYIMLHEGHPFYGWLLGGLAFIFGEMLIRRPE